MTNNQPQLNEPSRVEIIEAGYSGDVELINAALINARGNIRSAALGASLRSGNLDANLLTPYLSDTSAEVRRRASELSPRIEATNDLVAALVERLGDEDQIAEIAAFGLGEIGEAAPELVTNALVDALATMALNHEDALCREAAVASLGALHSRLDVILEAMGDKATVRRRAVIALSPFEGPDVEAAIKEALSDRDWQVRQAAEDQLVDPATNDGDGPS